MENEEEIDVNFNRQVLRAANKLAYGQHVCNSVLSACAAVFLRDVQEIIPNCSSGSDSFSLYVGPHTLGKRKS